MAAARYRLRAFFFTWLTTSFCVAVNISPQTKEATMVRGITKDAILESHVYHQTRGRSRINCAASCAKQASSCHSFNYCDASMICELNSAKAAKYPQDWTNTEGCTYYDIFAECEMTTSTTYRYQYLSSDVDVRRIDFRVKASNDVHIGLSPQPADNPAMYETVIGGWYNTGSALRRCKQCTDLATNSESGLLNSNQFRGFWITFDPQSGRLAVGKEGEAVPFMEWVDPSPINAMFLGFSTSWGSTGIFQYLCSV